MSEEGAPASVELRCVVCAMPSGCPPSLSLSALGSGGGGFWFDALAHNGGKEEGREKIGRGGMEMDDQD